jgi:hypothetical protein
MKQTTCEADLVGLALDALPTDEMKAASQHVAICRACDRLLAEYEETAAVLGVCVIQILPPRKLKRRVLRAAAAHRRASESNGRYSHESG